MSTFRKYDPSETGKNQNNDMEDPNKLVRPFEWLTSPNSLKVLIDEYVIRPLLLSSSQGDGGMNNSTVVGRISSTSSGAEETTTSSSQRLRRRGLRRPLQALHVGCGSSTVGEYLVTDMGFEKVINVDMDEDTMLGMEARWSRKSGTGTGSNVSSETPIHLTTCLPLADRLEFLVLDFTKESLPRPRFDNAFDLVLDKSTLDCTLCSDIATASLLVEVYRTLKEDGGVYIVISFHEVDLLLPLLRDLPGAHWTVDYTTMDRHLEQILDPFKEVTTSTSSEESGSKDSQRQSISRRMPSPSTMRHSEPERSSEIGSVKREETDDTRKKLNVFIARKTFSTPSPLSTETEAQTNSAELNFEAVCRHVHQVNDRWFQEQNPLMTEERIETLKQAFGLLGRDSTHSDKEGWHRDSESDLLQHQSVLLSLEEAYNVLFTDAEREHLTFEYFLQDWHAYQQDRRNNSTALNDVVTDLIREDDNHVVNRDDIIGSGNNNAMISFDVAVDFLRVTQ